MYKYGLGALPSFSEPALGLEEGSQRLDPSDPWYIGPSPTPSPSPTPDAGDIVGPVEDVEKAAGAVGNLLKTPFGLGAIGAIAGFVLTRGKRKKTRTALLGAALGAGAGYMLQRG